MTDGSESTAAVERLLAAFDQLAQAFRRNFPVERMRGSDARAVLQYRAAERFLQTKVCEISRSPAAITGRRQELRLEPDRDGDHLIRATYVHGSQRTRLCDPFREVRLRIGRSST